MATSPAVLSQLQSYGEEVESLRGALRDHLNMSFSKGVTCQPIEYLNFLRLISSSAANLSLSSGSLILSTPLTCSVEGEHWRRQFVKVRCAEAVCNVCFF